MEVKMKKLFCLWVPILALLIGVLFLTRTATQAATTKVGCEPQNLTVRTGQTFYVTLIVTDAQDLYAWQFNTKFYNQYLEFVTMLPGNHLRVDDAMDFQAQPVLNAGSSTSEARYAAATRLGKDSGVDGSGQLAHILFRALKQKTDGTTVDMNTITLLDHNALEIQKDYVNSADCRVIIRNDAPIFEQPPVGELIFLPVILR
jgi:hypothetical protein